MGTEVFQFIFIGTIVMHCLDIRISVNSQIPSDIQANMRLQKIIVNIVLRFYLQTTTSLFYISMLQDNIVLIS